MNNLKAMQRVIYNQNFHAFIISIFLATVCFLIGIGKLNRYIGFATQQDGGTLYTAALVHLSNLLHKNMIPQGIDWLTLNGSSDFFLRSNISALYPPLWLACIIAPKLTSLQEASVFHLFFVFTHMAISGYFIQLLARNYFSFTSAESIFLTCFYLFSQNACLSLAFMPFYLALCLFPVIVYCSLYVAERKSYISAFLLSFIIFNYIFIGYLPLALAGVLLSFIFSLTYIYWLKPDRFEDKLKAAVNVGLCNACGLIFAAPGVLAIVNYVHTAEPLHMRNLSYAAFSIAKNLNQFASSLISELPTGSYEIFGIVGLMGLLISIAFIANQNSTQPKLTELNSRLLKFALAVFTLCFLLQFGQDIPLGVLFYYFVPGLGDMHSYQRYSIFGLFFFSIFITIAVSHLNDVDSTKIRKLMSGSCFFIAAGISLLYEFYPDSIAESVNWVSIISTLLLASILFLARFFYSNFGAIIVAAMMITLSGLPSFYWFQKDFKVDNNITTKENSNENQVLIDFFKLHSQSKIIKYINLTPTSTIYSYVPRNYPWVVQNDVSLSEYMGYDYHISGDRNYRTLAPTYGEVNWNWLRKTGSEFLIINKESIGKFSQTIKQYSDPEAQLHLSNGDTVIKLNTNFLLPPSGYRPDIYTNGYIIISHTEYTPQVSKFKASHQKLRFNLVVNDSKTALTLPFWPNRNLHMKVNGIRTKMDISDQLYTHIFTKGTYQVEIYYQNTLLTIFLCTTSIYLLMLFITGAFLLKSCFIFNKNSRKHNEA